MRPNVTLAKLDGVLQSLLQYRVLCKDEHFVYLMHEETFYGQS